MRRLLQTPWMSIARRHMTRLLCDPVDLCRRWCGIPFFFLNLVRWQRLNRNRAFGFRLAHADFNSFDRFAAAGTVGGHYFHQDIWAARRVFTRGTTRHVDVGSRLDGFVAHILPFCQVEFVDLRPLATLGIDGLVVRTGSILALPYPDAQVDSLSCLHVIEHIGLGRYGDPIAPDGHLKAARELARVLKPGGVLLLGTPVGRERLCFDAHRVFAPETVLGLFGDLKLKAFWLIDDTGMAPTLEPDFERARHCNYGCGLFEFTKQ